MTTHNPIDDLFSKGLGAYSEQPSEAVWTGVEKKLHARRLWLRGFYLTGALLVLIGLITLSIWLFQYNTKPLTNNKTALKQTSAPNNVLNETAINVERKTDSGLEADISEPFLPLTKQDNKEAPHKISVETTSKRNENKVAPVSLPKVTADNNKPAVIVQEAFTQQLLPANENIGQKPTAEPASIAISNATAEPASKTVAEEIAPASKLPLKVQEENTAMVPEVKPEATASVAPAADIKTSETQQDSSAVETPLNKPCVVPALPPATNYSPYKPRFEVLFYALPSYVFRSYTGQTDTENAFRRDNEINPLFVNYGMEFRCTLKNFTIQTGVLQRQVGEKYAYDYNFIQHIDTSAGHYNVVITSHPDSANPGNTIITFDSSWVSVSDTTTAAMKLNHLNVYKYMEIPFNLGYVLNFEQHQIGVSGGFSLGLLSYASSGLLNSSANEIMPIATGSPMLRKMIYAYNVSLFYGFHVNAQTTLFMQAAYNQNLSGILKNTGFDVKYRSADAKIGVMFKL